MTRYLRVFLSHTVIALGALLSSTAANGQVCPWPHECTYIPPLLPPAPTTMSPAQSYGGSLFFASPDVDSALTFQYRDITVSGFGLAQSLAAFVPYPPGYGMASAFDTVEPAGTYMQSLVGYILTLQMGTSDGANYTARIRSHTSALGKRFRVAGFSLDASNGDDAGFDFVGIYAPQDCNVTAAAPPQAYARLQAMAPDRYFWQRNAGPRTQVFIPAGRTFLLRTKGADPVAGARGFPIDGSLITSDKPISVTVGGRGWSFDEQNNVLGSGDGVDGIVPTEYLGRKYVVSGSNAPHKQQARVTTDSNNVRLSVNGNVVCRLDAGDTYTLDTPPGLSVIEASDIVAVYQSSGLYGANNDLAMVQPAEFANLQNMAIDFDVLTGALGTLFILIPTGAEASITLNDTPAGSWNGNSTATVAGHPEWTAVWLPQIPAGGYVLHAHADMVASLLVASPRGGAFSYISRIRRPGCGDGVISGTEECDDGNIGSFDGCSSMCNLEPNFVCRGQPSVCTMNRNNNGDGNGDDVSIPAATCVTAGCPADQWCSTLGCVDKLDGGAPCASDDQCVANFCAEDHRCAQRVGRVCTSDAMCRSDACVQSVCVDPNARLRGGGLMSCASSGRGGPLQGGEMWGLGAMGCGMWAVGPAARRRRRQRHSRRVAANADAGPMGIRGLQRRGWQLWAAVGAGLWGLCASPAQAADGFSLNPLPMQQMGTPWLVLDGLAPSPDLRPKMNHRLGIRLGGRLDDTPLFVQSGDRQGSLGTVVSDQASVTATFAYWWREQARLSLSIPLQVHTAGHRVLAAPSHPAAPRHAVALGDIRAAGTWVFWRSREHTWRTGLDAQLLLPSGNQSSYAGNNAMAGTLTLGLSGRWSRWDAALALAAWVGGGPRHTDAAATAVGLSPRAGAGVYWARDAWHLGLEVPVQVALSRVLPGAPIGTTWADPLLSLRYQWSPRWAALLGAGTSITGAPGEARYRILAAVDAVAWGHGGATAPAPACELPPTWPTPAVPAAPPSPAAAEPAPPPLVPAPLPAAATAPVTLPYRVQFALESPHYGPESRPVLREMAAYMKTHPGVVVLKVMGYTDITGTRRYNQALSERRAQNVKRALQRLGVSAERLRAQGFGAQAFSQDNATRLGRQANRRVIFVAFEHHAEEP